MIEASVPVSIYAGDIRLSFTNIQIAHARAHTHTHTHTQKKYAPYYSTIVYALSPEFASHVPQAVFLLAFQCCMLVHTC